jgi:transcription antitermination factor NusG
MNCLQNVAPEPAQFPWYGIHTKSNCENVAANVLQAKGYQHYLPSYRVSRQWSDRTVQTTLPLFPGYVFCRFDAHRCLPIITTLGVASIVGFGKEPAPIPEQEIEAIQRILQAGLSPEPAAFLREGQAVRLKRGALEGVEGILLKKKTEWRMVVSITMLQRSISVEVDRDWVGAV